MRKRVILIALVVILLILVLTNAHKKEPKYVLLSFDVEVGDSRGDVESVLEVLEKNNVKASFFLTGEFAEQNAELVRKISEKYEVGCHSYNHSMLTRLDSRGKEMDIKKCIGAIETVAGKKPFGFRAPWNRIDKETMQLLEEYNFTYDASFVEHYSALFPEEMVKEIPVSSYCLFPLEDVIFFHYLKSPGLFFTFAKNKKSETISLLFHPHIITKEIGSFDELVIFYKNQGIEFLEHGQLNRKI